MFFVMEVFSVLQHKYIMHGFLWSIHRDHHFYTGKKYQKNDLFSYSAAAVAIILLVTGFFSGFDLKFSIGLGMTVYGVGYFIFHDGVFHHRYGIKYKPKGRFIKRILNAHAMHHQKSNKPYTGVSFGFFIVSKKYDVQ